jgi:hypothetical protein
VYDSTRIELSDRELPGGVALDVALSALDLDTLRELETVRIGLGGSLVRSTIRQMSALNVSVSCAIHVQLQQYRIIPAPI